MDETRILIVDDEKSEGILMEKCVDWIGSGFRVVGSVQSSRDALNAFTNLSPDIVLCDIDMPVLNGLELSRRMKAQRPDIHILIITEYRDFDSVKQALQIGADDYILKPVKPGELLTAAQKIRTKIGKSSVPPVTFSPVHSELVCKAIDYIESNLSQKGLSLKIIAPALFVNSSYLSRVFKESTGETVTEFILRRRMEKCCELLDASSLHVYELAAAVGIPDAHYFGQCFKRFTGKTVSEYRQKRVSAR